MPIVLEVEKQAREVWAESEKALARCAARGDGKAIALIYDARRKMKTFLDKFRDQPIEERNPSSDHTTEGN
jgi:hypothetical protein